MAVYKIFPTKDATIYSRYPAKNTGLDSIIEAIADFSTGTAQVSRYLIQFSQEEIDSIIDDKISGSGFQVNLKNYIANITNLNTDTTLEIYPVSGSWNMGTGRFNDDPETDNGVSWKYKTYSGSGAWSTSGFANYVTASYSNTPGGGTWYTGSALGLNVVQSKVYNYNSSKDLDVNVTNTIKTWYSASNNLGGFTNDGFIIKQSSADEFVASLYKQAHLQFYSIDTNTIYPPELQFKWNDFSYVTSSAISTINTTQMVVALDNNPGVFRREEIHKFRIDVRPEFPTRVFSTSSLYTPSYYLPQTSYYAIKDLDTNEFIFNFDDTYTKISADTVGSYFTIYMNGLEPERYYQILLKVVLNGETIILGDNYYFKIING
jgi:hypothetical protein